MDPRQALARKLHPIPPKVVEFAYKIKVKIEVETSTPIPKQLLEKFTRETLKGQAHIMLEAAIPVIDVPGVQPAYGGVFSVTFDPTPGSSLTEQPPAEQPPATTPSAAPAGPIGAIDPPATPSGIVTP